MYVRAKRIVFYRKNQYNNFREGMIDYIKKKIKSNKMHIKSAEFMAFLRILCYSIFVTECEWRITHFIGIFLTINREFLLVYYIFSGRGIKWNSKNRQCWRFFCYLSGKRDSDRKEKYLKIYPASAVDLAQGRKKNF